MQKYKYDAAVVRREAKEQWDMILGYFAPEIDPALQRPGHHIACPVHGGKDGFRVFKDVRETGGGICNTCGKFSDGFSLLMWLRNWDFVTTLEAVANLLGTGELAQFETRRAPAPKKSPERANVSKRLSETWMNSIPITDKKAAPIQRYFESRGIPMDQWLHLVPNHHDVIRFHPSLTYYLEGELEGRFPAIICMVSAKDGSAVSLHRTYLSPTGEGKANVPSPKKLMPSIPGKNISGGAIRLGPILNGTVQGAEGLETSIAVMTARQKPVWPLISDTLMASFDPSDDAHNVIYWADKDREQLIHGKLVSPGLDAAQKGALRLHEQGRKVRIMIPQYPIPEGQKSLDWLDVLNIYGPEHVGPAKAVVQLPKSSTPENSQGILSKVASIWRAV